MCNLLNNNNQINLVNESWLISTISILGWEKINYNKQKYLIKIFNKSQEKKTNHKIISLKFVKKKKYILMIFIKK